MTNVRRALRGWYGRNKREMPWRVTRDGYRIWISEVMLQQTRVAAVLPYYRRFLRRFPNVRALARARTEEVLRLWAGLGYYSRARNLHRAAKEIVARHGGRFPREYDAALALPGVGQYTAAAVLSMAYGAPHAVLDGNVARVLARLDAVRGDLRAPKRWRQLQERAQELLDARAPGDWNQAMMELGATVCTPRNPRCGECPLARWCEARRRGIAEQVPAPRKKRAAMRVKVAAAVLLDGRGRTLLVRGNGGVFSGMWQFPAVEVRHDAGDELARYLKKISPQIARSTRQRTGGQAQRGKRNGRTEVGAYGHTPLRPLRAVRHSVTFREVTLVPHLVRVRELPRVEGARVAPLAKIERLAISSATRKIARAASAEN